VNSPIKLTLDQLREHLYYVPVMAKMHPLSVAFLSTKNPTIFPSSQQLVDYMDKFGKEILSSQYLLTLDWQPQYASRLLAVEIDHNPFTSELNTILFDQWDWVNANLLKQSDISQYIVDYSHHQDCIILLLIDGLSWIDLSSFFTNSTELKPVIVDGISNTKSGMTRIVGQPKLVYRLPLSQCYGFSYWKRDNNTLTDFLFDGFGENVKKIRSFDEVLSSLEILDLKDTYVQIVRQGLDGICHQHRDSPNPQSYIQKLYDDFLDLVDLVKRKQITARIYLTSDHGILWQQNVDLQVFDFGKNNRHPRYLENRHPSQKVKSFPSDGDLYCALEYPYISRQLKRNEWGVHGGISFEESIVPLLEIPVNQE
jgi:hypothetical protein